MYGSAGILDFGGPGKHAERSRAEARRSEERAQPPRGLAEGELRGGGRRTSTERTHGGAFSEFGERSEQNSLSAERTGHASGMSGVGRHDRMS